MRRSSLNKSEFGIGMDSLSIVPPRQTEVGLLNRPENDVAVQYTPEELLKIAQKRVQWGEENQQKRLSREKQLENDVIQKAKDAEVERDRESARGHKKGEMNQTFSLGRATPLNVDKNGRVEIPVRHQEMIQRPALEVRLPANEADNLSKFLGGPVEKVNESKVETLTPEVEAAPSAQLTISDYQPTATSTIVSPVGDTTLQLVKRSNGKISTDIE